MELIRQLRTTKKSGRVGLIRRSDAGQTDGRALRDRNDMRGRNEHWEIYGTRSPPADVAGFPTYCSKTRRLRNFMSCQVYRLFVSVVPGHSVRRISLILVPMLRAADNNVKSFIDKL